MQVGVAMLPAHGACICTSLCLRSLLSQQLVSKVCDPPNAARIELAVSGAAAAGMVLYTVPPWQWRALLLLWLLLQVRAVIGIDNVESAIADAHVNASLNGITNADFVCDTAENAMDRVLKVREA